MRIVNTHKMLTTVSAYIVRTLPILVIIPIGEYNESFRCALKNMVSWNTSSREVGNA